MKFLEYIWAAIQFDTPWAMGRSDLQLAAWSIGMVAPLILLASLVFNLTKTTLASSILITLISVGLIATWIIQLDYWLNASPPSKCERDACDNDGTIRSLFAAGALLLPATLPSAVFGPLALVTAFRRSLAKRRSVKFLGE